MKSHTVGLPTTALSGAPTQERSILILGALSFMATAGTLSSLASVVVPLQNALQSAETLTVKEQREHFVGGR
jgi:hypothetical protein